MDVRVGLDLDDVNRFDTYTTQVDLFFYFLENGLPCVLNINNTVHMGYINLGTKTCVLFDNANYRVCEPRYDYDKKVKESGTMPIPVCIIHMLHMIVMDKGVILITTLGSFGIYTYTLQLCYHDSENAWEYYKPELIELFKKYGLGGEIPEGAEIYGNHVFFKELYSEFDKEKEDRKEEEE